jgi:hypothetical protein
MPAVCTGGLGYSRRSGSRAMGYDVLFIEPQIRLVGNPAWPSK